MGPSFSLWEKVRSLGPQAGATPMQTVRLGRTNATVSVAGLGCRGHSRLGMARGADTHQAADIVRRAIDLGVTFIDTARAYGAEPAVGEAIAGRRDQVFVSTKASPARSRRPAIAPQFDKGTNHEHIDATIGKIGTTVVRH